jgi:hypothetical protein
VHVAAGAEKTPASDDGPARRRHFCLATKPAVCRDSLRHPARHLMPPGVSCPPLVGLWVPSDVDH